MPDVTVTLPVITQAATPQAPAINSPNITFTPAPILRTAKVRRGPRVS